MPDPPPTHEVTSLLASWCDGDEAAFERLMPLVHGELTRLARNYMRRERPGHTLQPTALVNEAYMRLVDWKSVRWQNRAHFFGVAAQMMRRILVDFARARPAPKRDGGARLEGFERSLVLGRDGRLSRRDLRPRGRLREGDRRQGEGEPRRNACD